MLKCVINYKINFKKIIEINTSCIMVLNFFAPFAVVYLMLCAYLSTTHLQNIISRGSLGHCDRSTLIRCGFAEDLGKQFISSLKEGTDPRALVE